MMQFTLVALTVLASAAEGSETLIEAVPQDRKPRVAFVSNGIAAFWTIASAGAKAAGREFNVEVDIRLPAQGAADQQRIVEDLLARGIDGLAIAPADPDNQASLLAEAARHTTLITHDSDAPKSTRLCYVGMDNYAGGRMCGKLVKEALPAGGEVIIFIGRLEQDNARARRQGVIDELLDRPDDRTRYDAPGKPLSGGKYTIVDTRTDQFDYARAKQNAQDAIAAYPNLSCMVGLFEYNPPLMLDAVREAGKLGRIKLVAFDENDATLQGILDGHIAGTIVQNPYRYGYDSVRILAALTRGDRSVLPPGGFLDIPARRIVRDNVEAFRAELKKNLTAGADK
ncbi:MAG: ABC transporter substrate-binding protein [Planctomycetota bacterium]|nr:MAG: ABC transporter substrate-binding protein [Planctomycetota bacterium]